MALLFTYGWTSSREAIRLASITLYIGVIIVWSLLVHLNVELRGTDEKMYRWALNFTTSNPIKYNLGVLLLQTGRPAEAAGYLENVRAYYPEDSNITNSLSLAYWQLGHRWLAIRLLEDYAKHHPSDSLTRYHLRHMQSLLQKK